MKGFLDRIEDNRYAVILVEEIKKEFVIKVDELPKGSAEKSYFDLTVENDQIITLKLNQQATIAARQEVEKLQSNLRSKSSGSKFKK